ncbi:MAG: Outer membrane protein IcsA autotransporter [Pseudomonas citronellolis]|nr:MAG: Outer membrane protein IcsA autotransporter [Pseudomonas citronellolis]
MASRPPFPRKPQYHSALFLNTALLLPTAAIAAPAPSASPWHATAGQQLEATSSYAAQASGDTPLFVSDNGSSLEVATPGLVFSSTQDYTNAAKAQYQGKLVLNGAALTTSGKSANALHVEGSSSVRMDGGTIRALGGSATGIVVRDGSTAVLDGTRIEANAGIELTFSTLQASNITIETGSFNPGILLGAGSRAVVDQSSINTNNTGIYVATPGVPGLPHAQLELSNSTITTHGHHSTGLEVLRGRATLSNSSISTSGDSAHAIMASWDADISINGGHFSTQGADSLGVWAVSGATVKASGITISTQGTGAHGLYSEGTVEADGLSVETHGSKTVGIFAARGGKIGVTHANVQTHGDNARGLAVYASSTLDADDVHVLTRGKDSYALQSSLGHTTLKHSSLKTEGAAAAILANGNAGTQRSDLTLDDVQVYSQQAQAVDAQATNLDLSATDSTLAGGNGQLLTVRHAADAPDVDSTVNLKATRTTLQGDVISDSTANQVRLDLQDHSQLSGAIVNATQLDLDDSSTWRITGDSSLQTLNNAGTIAFDHNGSFHSLTVDGDYSGTGGHLVMNGALAGDDSPTNRLIIKGDVQAGTTQVSVNNLGGQGAQTQDGIELISVGGTSHGEFVKEGRIVAGAYDYDIVKRGENWYLDSTLDDTSIPWIPLEPADPVDPSIPWTPLEPAEPVDPSIPWTPLEPADPVDPDPKPGPKEHAIRPEGGIYAANLAAANTLFNTRLQDRQGGTQYLDPTTGEVKVSPLWMHSSVGRTRSHDSSNQLHISGQRSVMQFGSDLGRWTLDGTDSLRVGVMGGYANQKNRSKNARTGYHADGSLYGYSAGVYGTWFQNAAEQTGAYVDSWAQYSWFTAAIKGQDIAPEHYNAKGATASVESGYTWQWDSADANRRYRLQPQAQVTWMGVKADDHREANGTHVASRGNDSVQTRLGLRASVQNFFQTDDGTRQSYEPYAEVNWLNNSRDFGATMDNVRVNQDGARNIAEVKLGIEGQVTQRVSLWGNLAQQLGSSNYRDTGATLGVKVDF